MTIMINKHCCTHVTLSILTKMMTAPRRTMWGEMLVGETSGQQLTLREVAPLLTIPNSKIAQIRNQTCNNRQL